MDFLLRSSGNGCCCCCTVAGIQVRFTDATTVFFFSTVGFFVLFWLKEPGMDMRLTFWINDFFVGVTETWSTIKLVAANTHAHRINEDINEEVGLLLFMLLLEEQKSNIIVMSECGICNNGTSKRRMILLLSFTFCVARSRERESTSAMEVSSLLNDSMIGSVAATRLFLFDLGVIERRGGCITGQDLGRSAVCLNNCFLKFAKVGEGDRDRVALVLAAETGEKMELDEEEAEEEALEFRWWIDERDFLGLGILESRGLWWWCWVIIVDDVNTLGVFDAFLFAFADKSWTRSCSIPWTASFASCIKLLSIFEILSNVCCCSSSSPSSSMSDNNAIAESGLVMVCLRGLWFISVLRSDVDWSGVDMDGRGSGND